MDANANAIDSPECQNPLRTSTPSDHPLLCQNPLQTSTPSDHPLLSIDRTLCPTKRRSLQFNNNQLRISGGEETGVQNVSANGCFPISSYNVEVQKPSGNGLQVNRIVSLMHDCRGIIASPDTIATNSVSNIGNPASEASFVSTKPLNGISINSDLSLLVDDNGTPNKRRKKELIADVSYRRCNCRRTKCLKLYCDCFAAGEFCDKLCACQGCWNSELYEDSVFIVRQKIQSRNPLAFVPKIQQDDGTYSTPSLARHIRGCNCKKSKCLKKYCECYQANIGCSDGCRCEECENVLGGKHDSSDMQVMVAQQNDLCITHNRTPTAETAYEDGAASPWYSSGNYITSHESGAIIDTPYEIPTKSTFHQDINNEMSIAPFDMTESTFHQDTNNEMISMAPFDQIQCDHDMDSLFNAGDISLLYATPTNDQIKTMRSVHPHALHIDPINHFGENGFLGMPEILVENPTSTPTPTDIVRADVIVSR